LRVAGRETIIGVFGTATNVLGRTNTLATYRGVGGDETEPVSMRPRSPLVVGVESRF
jgi:hypothetical protein